MLLETDGKALFWELCMKLNELKLVTDKEGLSDTNSVQSVPFFFHEKISQLVNYPGLQKQVAAVQYNGGRSNRQFNQVTGVILRIYVSPLSIIGVEDVLENYKAYRSELKGPQSSPYYNYIFVDPYEEVYDYINALFTDLDQKLKSTLNSIQANLPSANLPESIKLMGVEPVPM